MDYKSIIKDRNTRLKILRLFSFIPDKTMIKLQYKLKTGRRLNLENPQRYTEKMQYLKLYERDPRMIQCTDKYDVREYVESVGCGNILNQCYGIYTSVDQIDFESLPESFVLKDTLGGAGAQVIIVKDKHKVNIKKLKRKLDSWLSVPAHIKGGGREWAYLAGNDHRIICEEYIASDESEGGLIDYKFHCYKGVPKYLYVIADRKLGRGAGLGIFDTAYNRLPYQRLDERILVRDIPKPKNFEQMLEIASKLSEAFIYTRVDLYDVDNKIIFGEISFYDASGYMTFYPDEFDFMLGNDIDLSEINPDRMKEKVRRRK